MKREQSHKENMGWRIFKVKKQESGRKKKSRFRKETNQSLEFSRPPILTEAATFLGGSG